MLHPAALRVSALTLRLLIAAVAPAVVVFGADLTELELSIQDAIQAGNLDEASRLLASALAQHPGSAGLLNLRGIVHAQRNEPGEARQDFADAVRRDPALTPAWQNLARNCQVQPDVSGLSCAADAWQHVLKAKPVDSEAHDGLLSNLRELVIGYEQDNRLGDARTTLERLAAEDPKNPAHLLELARLAEKAKQHEEALGYLAHARDLDPNDAQTHFLFGMIAFELDLPVEAKRSLERALAIAADNPEYNYAMGSVILTSRDTSSAAAYFQKFVDAKPFDMRGQYALGVAYFAAGDYEKARQQMQVVVSSPETSGGAEYFLGRIAHLQGQPQEAEQHLRKSIELVPTFSESHTELARALLLEGRAEEAHSELDRAIALDPKSFQANAQLLALYQRTHDARAKQQAEVLKQLDEERSKRAELMLRTIEVRP